MDEEEFEATFNAWCIEQSYMLELKSYPNDYRNCIRMIEDTFNFLVELLRDDIRKRTTTMREAIPPEDRLAICLRFLATGKL
jgi:hypothetical protein